MYGCNLSLAITKVEGRREQKKQMKTDTEVNNEIVALSNALALTNRWNAAAREQLLESVEVLKKRMTPEQVKEEYYVEETSADYCEGDNDLWISMDRVARWLTGEFEDAPSTLL